MRNTSVRQRDPATAAPYKSVYEQTDKAPERANTLREGRLSSLSDGRIHVLLASPCTTTSLSASESFSMALGSPRFFMRA